MMDVAFCTLLAASQTRSLLSAPNGQTRLEHGGGGTVTATTAAAATTTHCSSALLSQAAAATLPTRSKHAAHGSLRSHTVLQQQHKACEKAAGLRERGLLDGRRRSQLLPLSSRDSIRGGRPPFRQTVHGPSEDALPQTRPSPPPSTSTSTVYACAGDARKEASRRQRRNLGARSRHLCSRCGECGHNIRSCPAASPRTMAAIEPWYRQRCGRCGECGHNAQTCARLSDSLCRVCKGRGRLPCDACDALGYLQVDPPTGVVDHGPAKAQQQNQRLASRRGHYHHHHQQQQQQQVSELPSRGSSRITKKERSKLCIPIASRGRIAERHQQIGAVALNEEEKALAAKARARARNLIPGQLLPLDEQDLVGSSMVVVDENEHESNAGGTEHSVRFRGCVAYTDMDADEREEATRCLRCTGLGYLSCLACAD